MPDLFTSISSVVQIMIIAVLAWLFYRQFIRGSASEKFVRGLFGLLGLWIVSWIFMELGLGILGNVTRWVALFMSIGLVVIFQPELRKFLGMMGQITFLRAMFFKNAFIDAEKKKRLNHTADEIVRAAEYMSKKHTGALMVFQKGLSSTVDKIGTRINGDVSSELLITIFFNKTPLHDGAVIISGAKILFAGAILPLTEKNNLDWKYGTRHRAAIGMSEVSDAVVLVVSEETGDISIAKGGVIKKYDDIKKLRARIRDALDN
ncbi:MAG: diadenylate cyclase CdaA [Alphaproteobacteria bacterium]|nr:diadenylate cyclase CdaA [Alphaproteobacteria bacterium]MCL2890207.1 diadenylate cyclase CdaA [Alphaproteobacteria bacterium]